MTIINPFYSFVRQNKNILDALGVQCLHKIAAGEEPVNYLLLFVPNYMNKMCTTLVFRGVPVGSNAHISIYENEQGDYHFTLKIKIDGNNYYNAHVFGKKENLSNVAVHIVNYSTNQKTKLDKALTDMEILMFSRLAQSYAATLMKELFVSYEQTISQTEQALNTFLSSNFQNIEQKNEEEVNRLREQLPHLIETCNILPETKQHYYKALKRLEDHLEWRLCDLKTPIVSTSTMPDETALSSVVVSSSQKLSKKTSASNKKKKSPMTQKKNMSMEDIESYMTHLDHWVEKNREQKAFFKGYAQKAIELDLYLEYATPEAKKRFSLAVSQHCLDSYNGCLDVLKTALNEDDLNTVRIYSEYLEHLPSQILEDAVRLSATERMKLILENTHYPSELLVGVTQFAWTESLPCFEVLLKLTNNILDKSIAKETGLEQNLLFVASNGFAKEFIRLLQLVPLNLPPEAAQHESVKKIIKQMNDLLSQLYTQFYSFRKQINFRQLLFKDPNAEQLLQRFETARAAYYQLEWVELNEENLMLIDLATVSLSYTENQLYLNLLPIYSTEDAVNFMTKLCDYIEFECDHMHAAAGVYALFDRVKMKIKVKDIRAGLNLLIKTNKLKPKELDDAVRQVAILDRQYKKPSNLKYQEVCDSLSKDSALAKIMIALLHLFSVRAVQCKVDASMTDVDYLIPQLNVIYAEFEPIATKIIGIGPAADPGFFLDASKVVLKRLPRALENIANSRLIAARAIASAVDMISTIARARHSIFRTDVASNRVVDSSTNLVAQIDESTADVQSDSLKF